MGLRALNACRRSIAQAARIVMNGCTPSRPAALGSGHELIVCTRFAHWLSPQDLTVLFGRFSATGSRYLLLGAMVRPRRRVQPNPSQKGWRDHLKSLRTWLRPRPPEYVHDEAFMLQALRECGWTLTARTPVSRSAAFITTFTCWPAKGRTALNRAACKAA